MSNNCETCAFFRPARKEKPKIEDFPAEYVTFKKGHLWWRKEVTDLRYVDCDIFSYYPEEFERYEIDNSQVIVAKDIFDYTYTPRHLAEYVKALREYHARGQCVRFPKVEPTDRYYSCGEYQA